MTTHRAAIVGCGGRADEHAVAYGPQLSAKLVACCDLDRDRAEAFAAVHRVPQALTSIAELAELDRLDLVHVVTPGNGRVDVVEAVLAVRPRALLIEKPIAVRPSELERLEHLGREAGVPIYVNHQLRFHSSVNWLRQQLAGGAIGPIRSGRASVRSSLQEQGCHALDMVHYLLRSAAPFRRVFAQASGWESAPMPDSPAYTAAVIEVDAGWRLYLEAGEPGAPHWRGEEDRWLHSGVELVGEEGVAGWSLNRGAWVRDRRGENALPAEYLPTDRAAQTRLTATLLEALEHGTDHRNALVHARVAADTIFAIERSAAERAWVEVADGASDADVEALRTELVGAPLAVDA
jgi:predicted dehydrogenase